MRRFQSTVFVLLLAMLGAGVGESSAQWPQFRGPNGSGVDSGAGYPVAFSPTSNVVWKAAMPFGQSSPVVAGGRVYLTGSEGGKLLTISLDAATGREVWRRDLKPAHSQKVYHANDPASPTPAADADGVVVFFPDFGLAAYGADGKERWTMPLGPFKSFYGMSASPIIAGDLVVLLCDQRAGSFLVAVDRKTGKVRWRKDRPGVPEGWATPMVFRATADAPAQLVTLGTTRIDSYALETGESRWWMPVGSSGSMGIPVASGETLFVTTSGGSEPNLPAFETYLAKLDTDKNGQLSHKEFLADKEMGEHFGWLDENGDESHRRQGVADHTDDGHGRVRRGRDPGREGQRQGRSRLGGLAREEEPAVHPGAAALQERPLPGEDGRDRYLIRSGDWEGAERRTEHGCAGRLLCVADRRR